VAGGVAEAEEWRRLERVRALRPWEVSLRNWRRSWREGRLVDIEEFFGVEDGVGESEEGIGELGVG
jgi:hypothetical protein